MTLDDYIIARFGPVFDALNDAGGVPDELMECLRKGVLVEAMLAKAVAMPETEARRFVTLDAWFDGELICHFKGLPYSDDRSDDAMFSRLTDGTGFIQQTTPKESLT